MFYDYDGTPGTPSGSADPAAPFAVEGKCVPCQPVMCELYCDYGFAIDDNGCSVCACNPVNPSPCKRTGCSSQICAAEEMPSTCEYIDYYQCYDLAECGLNAAGECGWISNSLFNQCMVDFGQQP